MKVLKGILSQISFFTILPSVKADLDEIAEYSFISPIFIGVITGVIDFFAYLGLYQVLGELAKYAMIAVIEIIRGFNHLDGLLDFGDAIMIRGDYERRIKALKDVQIGSGGIGFAIIYLVLMFIAIATLPSPSVYALLSLISSEITCRAVALLALSVLPPMEISYLGKVFHKKLRNKHVIILVQALPFILGYTLISFAVFFLLFYYLAKILLKGSSGDLAGAMITLSFPIFLIIEDKYCFLYYLLHYL